MSGDPAIFPVAVSQTTALRSSLAVTDRKSTRLNSSHSEISYAVFCLKKKKKKGDPTHKITKNTRPAISDFAPKLTYEPTSTYPRLDTTVVDHATSLMNRT